MYWLIIVIILFILALLFLKRDTFVNTNEIPRTNLSNWTWGEIGNDVKQPNMCIYSNQFSPSQKMYTTIDACNWSNYRVNL